MFSLVYRVIFWGVLLAMGTQGGYSIYKLRNEMRAKALTQVSRPWPKLPVAPKVDHSINPYIFKKHKKINIDRSTSNAIDLYADIYDIFKKKNVNINLSGQPLIKLC